MVQITAIPALAERLADQTKLDQEIDRVFLAKEILRLKEEIRVAQNGGVEKVAKNKKPGKASAGRKYVLLSSGLAMFGKVPLQQSDIAALLVKAMVVGTEYTEQEVFDFLIDGCGDYTSLYTSTQDVTYLFRYYRGLKNDGKHAGFIARNFIRVIG